MEHSQLSKCLTEYYETLAALTYIDPSNIVRPPPNGHTNVDTEAACEQGFDQDMISLMRRLPYLDVCCEDTPVLPNGTKSRYENPRDHPTSLANLMYILYTGLTHNSSYLDVDYMDWARDPTFEGHMTKATHLVLTNPAKAGIVLIYDTANETLTPWSPIRHMLSADFKARLESGQETDPGMRYEHLPTFPPEQLLGQWTKNLISLTWIPYRDDSGWPYLIEQPTTTELRAASDRYNLLERYQLDMVRRTLKDVYVAAGWAIEAQCLEDAKRDFDQTIFQRKRLEWRETTQALLDEAYHQKWTWSAIRERLGLLQGVNSLLDSNSSSHDASRPCTHLRI